MLGALVSFHLFRFDDITANRKLTNGTTTSSRFQ